LPPWRSRTSHRRSGRSRWRWRRRDQSYQHAAFRRQRTVGDEPLRHVTLETIRPLNRATGQSNDARNTPPPAAADRNRNVIELAVAIRQVVQQHAATAAANGNRWVDQSSTVGSDREITVGRGRHVLTVEQDAHDGHSRREPRFDADLVTNYVVEGHDRFARGLVT